MDSILRRIKLSSAFVVPPFFRFIRAVDVVVKNLNYWSRLRGWKPIVIQSISVRISTERCLPYLSFSDVFELSSECKSQSNKLRAVYRSKESYVNFVECTCRRATSFTLCHCPSPGCVAEFSTTAWERSILPTSK